MIYIGVDLGGTRLKIGIIKDGRIAGRTEIPAEEKAGLGRRLPVIKAAADQLIRTCGCSGEELCGIGFGFPGIIETGTARILSTPKYLDATDIDLSDWARTTWGADIRLENDSRLACLGEWKAGSGIGFEDFVMVTLGTGFGSSAVIDGKLLKGVHNQAGILGGHMIIDYRGGICKCGNKGCLETAASSWILPERAEDFGLVPDPPGTVVSYEFICREAENGNEKAIAILEDSIDAWSSGIINLIHAYDPEAVIIGGGIMRGAKTILPEIEKRVSKYAWTPWGKVKILPSSLKNDAALLGAYWLFNE